MTRLFIGVIILLLVSCSEKQLSNDNISVVSNNDTIERKCECIDTLIVDSLNPKPPFNEVSKIISYEFKDTIMKASPTYENIIANGKLNRKYIIKEVDITSKKEELEKILFNKTEKCNNGTLTFALDCAYNPHHCIVFYNKKGIATDFIEICFICDMKMTSTNNSFGVFCGKTYCELRNLFKECGYKTERLYLEQCL